MNWTVKNLFVPDFKGHGHDTDDWRDYDEDNAPFEQLEKVCVPDEDSVEQRMNIFHGFTEIIANFVFPFSSFFDKE